MNCGDWVEHFSAAECIDGNWQINYFIPDNSEDEIESSNDELFIPDKKQLYKSIVEELAVAAFFLKYLISKSQVNEKKLKLASRNA